MNKAFYDTNLANEIGIVPATIFWEMAKDFYASIKSSQGPWLTMAVKDIQHKTPWLTVNQVTYGIKKLKDANYWKSKECNNSPLDRTQSYTLTEKGFQQCLLWEDDIEKTVGLREKNLYAIYSPDLNDSIIKEIVRQTEDLEEIRENSGIEWNRHISEYSTYKLVRKYFASHNWKIKTGFYDMKDIVSNIAIEYELDETPIDQVLSILAGMKIINIVSDLGE